MNTPTHRADAQVRQTERQIRILEWIVCAALAAAVVLVVAAFWVVS